LFLAGLGVGWCRFRVCVYVTRRERICALPETATLPLMRREERAAAFSARADMRTTMPQFDATIKHIKEGLKGFTVSAAVKNIEGWETTLEKIDEPGVKTILKDLENLKKHLHADPLNGEQIKKLVQKLGKETVTLAGKTDSKSADRIKMLGETLTEAADGAQ
jgi:hypothetical protein